MGRRVGRQSPRRIIDAFVNGLDRTACRQVTLGSGPSPTTQTSCSKWSSTRPAEAASRRHSGQATYQTATPCDGSVKGSCPADPPCTPFGIGCLSRSSTCTPRRSNRPSLKGSPLPRTPCSTARPSGPALRHELVNEDKLTKRLQELNAAVAQDAAGQPIESQPYWMAATPNGRRQLERYRLAGDELADRLAENQERPKDKQLPRKKVKVSITEPEAPLGRG